MYMSSALVLFAALSFPRVRLYCRGSAYAHEPGATAVADWLGAVFY